MIVVDTGPLVALLNATDRDHVRCTNWLDRVSGPLLVPQPVLAEVCYLLASRAGHRAEAMFLRLFAEDEPFDLVPLVMADLPRMAELVERYADLPLGGVDASIVAVAERLGTADVATLDRRHFTVVRPKHVSAFRIVPEQT